MAYIIRFTQAGWSKFIQRNMDEYQRNCRGREYDLQGFHFIDFGSPDSAVNVEAITQEERGRMADDDVILACEERPPYAKIVRETEMRYWDR